MHILKAETILATGTNRLDNAIFLIHRPAGTYPAGSRSITTEERWSVSWEFDNARHGQWFDSLEEARDDFDTRNVGAGA